MPYPNTAPYDPVGSIDNIVPSTYYIVNIDGLHRRNYECKESNTVCT